MSLNLSVNMVTNPSGSISITFSGNSTSMGVFSGSSFGSVTNSSGGVIFNGPITGTASITGPITGTINGNGNASNISWTLHLN